MPAITKRVGILVKRESAVYFFVKREMGNLFSVKRDLSASRET